MKPEKRNMNEWEGKKRFFLSAAAIPWNCFLAGIPEFGLERMHFGSEATVKWQSAQVQGEVDEPLR